MYLEQVSIRVFAATPACCQPVLHSSAEQGTTVFCKDQCGTALKVDHCTHVFRASLNRCFCSNSSLLSACLAQQCRAGEYCILPRSVWHCTAHMHLEQVSLGVSAATPACCQPVLHSSGHHRTIVFCKDQCGTALKVGHCTHVFRASLHRFFCSNTSLLSACLAQQCRAGDYCILQRSVWHCTEGGPLHTCI